MIMGHEAGCLCAVRLDIVGGRHAAIKRRGGHAEDRNFAHTSRVPRANSFCPWLASVDSILKTSLRVARTVQRRMESLGGAHPTGVRLQLATVKALTLNVKMFTLYGSKKPKAGYPRTEDKTGPAPCRKQSMVCCRPRESIGRSHGIRS